MGNKNTRERTKGKRMFHLYDPKEGDRIPEHLRTIVREVHAKDGITEIPDRAFEDCHLLETLKLPSSVVTIGELACCDCWKLKNLILPEGLKTIGKAAFNQCRSLVEVEFPSTLETMNALAFYYCSSLRAIQIPPLVTTIESRTFQFCYSLQEVAVSAIRKIEMEAFLNCYNLKLIDFPDCLEEVDPLAFKGCFSLPINGMKLPASIKEENEDPFDCIRNNPWYPGSFSECREEVALKEGPGPKLGFQGQTQHGYGPEYWAISKEQLMSLEEHPLYDRQDADGNYNFTMRELVDLSVKRKTMESKMSLSLLLNYKKPLVAKIMVSHSWDEPLPEFVKPLKAYDGPFWVCSFAIYQNDDKSKGVTIAEQLGDDPSYGPFGTVLKLPDVRMTAVATFGCNIYTRLWCVFEMFLARQNGVDVDLSPFIDTVERYFGRVENDVCVAGAKEAVHSSVARCGNPKNPINEDELAIRAAIEASDGKFDSVDKAVEIIRFLYLLHYPLSKIGCNETTARDNLKVAIESVSERLPNNNDQRIQKFDVFLAEYLTSMSGFDVVPRSEQFETDRWGNVKGDHDYYAKDADGGKIDVYDEWINYLKKIVLE